MNPITVAQVTALVLCLCVPGGFRISSGQEPKPAPPAAKRADEKTDLERLQGEWRCVDAECGGARAKKDDIAAIRFAFEGDKFFGWQDGEKNEPRATFKLDPRKTPKDIDLVNTARKDNRTVLGIYSLEDGRLKLCMSGNGDGSQPTRPTAFATKAGEPVVLYVLEPVRAEKAPPGNDAKDPATPPTGKNQPDEKARKALEGFQGEWLVEKAEFGPDSQMKDGLKGLKGRKLRFKDDRLALPALDGSFEFTFKVNPAKVPAEIDLYADGKLVGLGIYSLDGDTLKLRYEPSQRFLVFGDLSPGADLSKVETRVEVGKRPASFDAGFGPLLVLKRTK